MMQITLVPYSVKAVIKNKKLRNEFLNYIVACTTKVLIPAYFPFTGVRSICKGP